MLGTLHSLSLMLKDGVGLGGVEGTVPKPDLPRANRSIEAALDLGSPPSVPGHCLFLGLPLLHTTPKRAAQHCPALDALWSHPAEQLAV